MAETHPALDNVEAGIAGESALNAAPVTSIVPSSFEKTSDYSLGPTLDGENTPQNGTAANGDVTRVGSNVDAEKAPLEDAEQGEGSGILTGVRLLAVFIGLVATVFLFALDQSIVATAIPVIVSDFKSFDAVGWVITAYFRTYRFAVMAQPIHTWADERH